ncbi:hypothetical protein HDU84_007583 [Entophlyctis sp. JEL0112]|nr:hypothetical protein HDU84_007583 [Entophlyctis sp. JEL0112]
MDEVSALASLLVNAMKGAATGPGPAPTPACALPPAVGAVATASAGSAAGLSAAHPVLAPPDLSRSPSLSSLSSVSTSSDSSSASAAASSAFTSVLMHIHSLVSLPDWLCRPSSDALESFRTLFCTSLIGRMRNHWHIDSPLKGSAYRSLSIANGKAEKVFEDAANASGIRHFASFFPPSITFWIDPGCVSVRIGDSGPILDLWTNPTMAGKLPTILPSPSTSLKMYQSNALPPSPPQISREQMRQAKLQQKQFELQDMANAITSMQYQQLYNSNVYASNLYPPVSLSGKTGYGSSYSTSTSTLSTAAPSFVPMASASPNLMPSRKLKGTTSNKLINRASAGSVEVPAYYSSGNVKMSRNRSGRSKQSAIH